MIKPLKVQTAQSILLADPHIGHDRNFIYESRGFRNIAEHDEYIFSNLESYLRENPNTSVFTLGDACLTKNQNENFDRLASIPCAAHYFIWGNHNAGALWAYRQSLPKEYSDSEIYPLRYKNITFVGSTLFAKISGRTFFLSHFPHSVWDGVSHGVLHLCGHSHGSFEDTLEGERRVGKVFDCGVDNAIRLTGRPFFLHSEIFSIMDKKSIVEKDHHGLCG